MPNALTSPNSVDSTNSEFRKRKLRNTMSRLYYMQCPKTDLNRKARRTVYVATAAVAFDVGSLNVINVPMSRFGNRRRTR